MKIGVIGNGVVGNATARCWMEHCDEVRVYDRDHKKETHDLISTLECDVVFVCLPTPSRTDGLGLDTSPLVEFFENLSKAHRQANLVLKSTVPVGFTRQTVESIGCPNLIHSPEFLTARCAAVDAQVPARNVIGYPGNQRPVCPVQNLYLDRWPHVPVHIMTSDESEAVKLVQNSFFAVKVAFWNEVNEYCSKVGLDYDVVLAAILADGRVHPSHTKVPGPDGKYGFGGSCLPKDLSEFYKSNLLVKLHPHVTLGAAARNDDDRKRTK